MRPLSLHLSNFGSFRGDHDLDLSGISCAVLSGPNGAGKSTLAVDSLLFALFGQSRGATLDSVISEGEDLARVELPFALGEDTCLVSRQVKRGRGCSGLTFEVNGESQDGKGVSETQRRIEQTLHMDANLFRHTALSAQGEAGLFSRMRPGERKALLGEGLLDSGRWERRAEAARALLRDLTTRLSGLQERHKALSEAFGQADGLRLQLAENEAAQAKLAAEIADLEKALTDAQDTKAGLVAAQQADAERRKQFDELIKREKALADTITAAETRLGQLDRARGGKKDLLVGIGLAEAAATEAAELEAKRQERERLTAQATVLAEQIKAAKDRHAADVRSLEQSIAALRREHEQKAKALQTQIAGARSQAEVLETVPCAATESKLLIDACPLIEQARAARDALPRLEEQARRLLAEVPWAEDAISLGRLRERTPAADLIEQRRKLREQYDAISYNAEVHANLKQAAGKLDSYRTALSRADAAEAQRSEVLAGLAKSRAEAKALTEQRSALATELGPARDWSSAITDIGAQISRTTDTLGEARRRERVLADQRGGLSEKLRAAEQAGKDAELLTAEIAEIERRRKLLHILGNTQDGAFSKSGIPALLIEQALPELQEAANEVLATLSDGRLSLELRTQAEAKSGLRETLDIVISDERGPRLYETFSGGEAMRVDLALRAGLSLLLARRAGARCSTLILDEMAAPLDSRGQEQFVEAVGRLSAMFELVLVITHCDALKDRFPARIEVSKDGAGSHAEVIAG